jgi:hypothetical protein
MPRSSRSLNAGWLAVQRNPSYLHNAVDDEEGRRIKWHSPTDELSSQVFCISAFGTLRHVGDGSKILNRLFAEAGIILPPSEKWHLRFEHIDRELLEETGQGTPTNVDVFCDSPSAVVCIESKFLFDAHEGFGGCSQIKGTKGKKNCAGYYGPGSDLKTRSAAHCRLEVADGRRGVRAYWRLGRRFFVESIFRKQSAEEACPFTGSNFQLMRNFLFAASAAGGSRAFGVLAIVPERTGSEIRRQVAMFKSTVLRDDFRPCVGVATYDRLVALLLKSEHEGGRVLGIFLEKRMTKALCPDV